MSRDELYEHLSYWQDDTKLAAYRAALAEVISPGDRVLDLGSGTGLLALLAVQAGAGEVWCYDDGPILGVARTLAEQNGCADRMHFVQESTTDAALPEVDVIVCDQIGGLVYDAGVLEYFADAARRALHPDGTLVPAAFEMFLVPIEAMEPYEQIAAWDQLDGFNTNSVRTLAANTEWRVNPADIDMLAPPGSIDSRDASDDSAIKATLSFVADKVGVVHGLSGWFLATMSPSVTLTNRPDTDDRMNRWLNFYPLAEPVAVAPGQRIDATFSVHVGSGLATWSLAVDDAPPQRMSTFNGSFMFDARASIGADGKTAKAEAKAAIATELLALAAAGASSTEMAEAAARRSDLFPTDRVAQRFARDVRRLIED